MTPQQVIAEKASIASIQAADAARKLAIKDPSNPLLSQILDAAKQLAD